MAKPMRSYPSVFLVAMLAAAMVFAAVPTLESCCPNETSGLAVIGHSEVPAIDDVPAGAVQLRPRLQSVAGRIYRASVMHHAVMGDRAPTMQVSPPRRISMRTGGPAWIDDPSVLTQASPRGPPSV
jgi:hypothetical protein